MGETGVDASSLQVHFADEVERVRVCRLAKVLPG
jgi:hypothetical protein